MGRFNLLLRVHAAFVIGEEDREERERGVRRGVGKR